MNVRIGGVTFIRRAGRGDNRTGPWECGVCGRRGWSTPSPTRKGWHTACLRGHLPCPYCGRVLTVLSDGTGRVHTRCRLRPDAPARPEAE